MTRMSYADEVATLMGELYLYWEQDPDGMRMYNALSDHCGMDHLRGASLMLATEAMRLIGEIVDFDHPSHPFGVFAYDHCERREDGQDLCTFLIVRMFEDDWSNLSQSWKFPVSLEAGIRRWAQLNGLPIKEKSNETA